MNKFIKFAVGAAIVAPALIAGSALAATFSNVQFQNGDVTISGTGGSTVSATFHVVIPANQVVENIQTDVIGDNLAPVCVSVGGDLGLQEGTRDVTVQVKLPPNTGTYTLEVKGAGIYGGIRSIDCNDNVVGTASFGGALRTVDSTGSTSGGSTSGSGAFGFSSFADFVAALKASLGLGGATTPPATTSAVCAAYAKANAGTQANVYNDANVRLQGFLLSEGASIPALKAGASFGFYGNQTTAAVGWFNSINHCN